jgi:hypothetical protein
MQRPLVLAFFALLAPSLADCSSSSGANTMTTPPDAGGDAAANVLSDGLPATCSPLRVNGACMLPWPNAIYTTSDATTKTGVHLALPSETIPGVAGKNLPFDTAPYDKADGFSPATPILVFFNERIDPASLVPPTDPSSSTAGPSATVLVDMTTNARVAHFSEVDATVRQDGDRQALIIHPLQRLAPAHQYAVAITTRIKTTDGGSPVPPPQFAAIADGPAPPDAMSQAQAARMPAVLKSLAAAGVKRSDLVVAWDFVTGSDEYLTSNLLAMRDQAFAGAPPSPGYTITAADANPTPQILLRVKGTFTVPRFLTSVDMTKPDSQINYDATGKPAAMGTYEAPFELVVPPVAATRPLPLVLFGHGFLGNASDLEGNATMKLASEKGYILFSTDEIGLSSEDSPLSTPNNGAIAAALADLSQAHDVMDRLQQAIVNMMVLARTVKGSIANDPKMSAGGKMYADPSKLFYWGISMGGILGGVMMSYDPDITQGVLGVPGGPWSLLLNRSYEYHLLQLLFTGSYPDYLDRQLMIAILQMAFDREDPTTTAPYVLSAPLAGVPKKQLVMQMSVDDDYVTNWATENMARTMGIPLLGPSVVTPYGMTAVTGAQASALTIWDVHPMPVPSTTNATPTTSNGAHTAIHTLQPLQDQIDQFFQSGQVNDTCSGPCDFHP